MKRNGFTLIELLIAVTIISILAMIAVPSYQAYMLKSRRGDAKAALTAVQLAQEKWRGNHDTYTSTLSDLGLAATSPAGYYTIAIASGSTGTTYSATATAVPSGPQGSDTCGVLTVTASGFSGNTTCWGLQ